MTAHQPSTTEATASRATLLPQIIYAYMLMIHLALPTLLYALYGKDVAGDPAAAAAAAPTPSNDMAVAGLVILLAAVAAYVVPRRLLKASSAAGGFRLPGAGNNHPLSRIITPYVVRLSCLEICTLTGFTVGLLHQQPSMALPGALVGLLGTLISPPTQAFFARFAATDR